MTPALRHVVVAGGGLAGLRAAESLRREGYEGRLTLIGEEPGLPYDRPPLSKEVLRAARAAESTVLRSAERLASLDLELLLGVGATDLDIHARRITGGDVQVRFDGLVIATGTRVRRLPALEGSGNVHVLRTVADAAGLRDALVPGARVVVVGAGFIGAEVAASARSRGCEVTVVELEPLPFQRVLGARVSAAVRDLHLEHGTALKLGAGVSTATTRPDGGLVLGLTDGVVLECDLAVLGVGVVPNVGWLVNSGLEIADGVRCDERLCAGADNVFAAGDVASWPNPRFGRRMRVEHWTNAVDQARHVARTLVHGDDQPFAGSNFFWSDLYGRRLQFVGTATDDPIVVDGSFEDRRFLVGYRDAGRLAGAVALDHPALFMNVKRAFESGSSWRDALAAMESSRMAAAPR